jgi:hypothetical protein
MSGQTTKTGDAQQRRDGVSVETVGATTECASRQSDFSGEEAFWRSTYPSRPYFAPDVPFETYAAAYRHGWEARSKLSTRSFADVERLLRTEWEQSDAGRQLDWNRARPAISDAWDRTDVNLLGES